MTHFTLNGRQGCQSGDDTAGNSKRQAVERMKGCDNIQALARELKVERKLLYTLKYQVEGRPEPRHANLAESAEQRQENQLRLENQRLKEALGG